MFTDKHYSLTIPDDPHMHQLLLLLLAKMLSELKLVDKYSGDSTRGPGKAAADVHGTVQAARAAAQEQSSCRGGGDSTAEEPGPGDPRGGGRWGAGRWRQTGSALCLVRTQLEHAHVLPSWQRRFDAQRGAAGASMASWPHCAGLSARRAGFRDVLTPALPVRLSGAVCWLTTRAVAMEELPAPLQVCWRQRHV